MKESSRCNEDPGSLSGYCTLKFRFENRNCSAQQLEPELRAQQTESNANWDKFVLILLILILWNYINTSNKCRPSLLVLDKSHCMRLTPRINHTKHCCQRQKLLPIDKYVEKYLFSLNDSLVHYLKLECSSGRV